MLRKIRLLLAFIFLTGTTLLFLDFTGTAHRWMGWMAKIQFLPAVLALNAGIIILLLLLTAVFGRIYCSVICPLGIMQDIAGWMGKKQRKNRYSYSPAKTVLRYAMLLGFIAAMAAGLVSLAALIAPYSSYGRIAGNLFAPVYQFGNNIMAYLAERMDSYAFYEKEVWIKSIPTFVTAIVTFIIICIMAWRNGRTYCNTICPVGTVLGFISKWSWLKPVIDTDKCINCGLCAKNCKAACIDVRKHDIDYSRCVACMDCIGKCSKAAISYRHKPAVEKKQSPADINKKDTSADTGRRNFLSLTALTATTAVMKAQQKKVDGGLAVIEDRQKPERITGIVPPGAWNTRHFSQHCTACQLCVSACPNGVLRPSGNIFTLMQPEMGYERGYCRPECTRCSNVCPTGAIRPITKAMKSSIQIGHAVWIKKNCVPLTDGVECGNCARHCPSGAITMIPSDAANPDSPKIPAVNVERCIGCGACENLCPARPFSAIYVEGHEIHREL
ncbi:4Fe-4S binding protein [Xylanibacter muris]|uniref:4Fe-4S binding protein n=1 Tax=Xylanibacter muris TaxID=2736290 RepID=A0ABX2AJA1_9BACT|nr:4Fe-4S binding protein [Xylanibacter muris]NPD90853.1 4Fe-4S binding protein [Xylanibacter muris]